MYIMEFLSYYYRFIPNPVSVIFVESVISSLRIVPVLRSMMVSVKLRVAPSGMTGMKGAFQLRLRVNSSEELTCKFITALDS